MIKIKYYISRLILFIIIISGMSCNHKESKVIFILFDLSGSTRMENVRNMYWNDFNKILEKVSPGDRIISDFITENPVAQSSFPVNIEFREFSSFSDNKTKFNMNFELKKENIKKTIHEILFDLNRKIGSTKILESLQLANRVFKIYDKQRKVLVLFSDMIEESPMFDFNNTNLSTSGREKILNQIKLDGTLPDLSDVRVYIVGAGAGTYDRMTLKKMNAVQNFWLDYFDACGAKLNREQYGGPLIGFEE